MTIGTSLGLTYEDEFHHAAGVAQNDNNVIDPDTDPDRQTSDNNGTTNKGPAQVQQVSDRQPGDVSIKFRDNVEDRRDQPNTIDYAGIKQDTENWITRRVPDILAQHMQPYFFGKSLDPGPSELGNQLGYSDIHTDKAIDQTSPVNNAIHGAVDTANLAGAMLQSYRQQPIHRIIDPNTEVPEDSDLTSIAKFGDKLLGRGQPRFQLWPERLIRNLIPDDTLENVGKIARGEFPMWQMDPNTGEFHTSDQAIQEGVGLAGVAQYTAAINPTKFGSGIPLTIHTAPEAHEALQEGPNAFQQFMRSRGQRQPSNIETQQPTNLYEQQFGVTPEEAAHINFSHSRNGETGEAIRFAHHYEEHSSPEEFSRYVDRVDQLHNDWDEHLARRASETSGRHPDEMTDEEFYDYGLRHNPGTMSPELEQRWTEVDRRLAEQNQQRMRELDPRTDDEIEEARQSNPDRHESYDEMEARWAEEDNYYAKYVAPRIREAPSVGKKGDLELKELSENDSTRHKFGFIKDDGTLGELSLHERRGGRDIYVDWIGSLGQNKQFDFGSKNMKDLIGILKDRFPDMETITGFRVSGARAKTGGGSAQASMRVRPPKAR